jgi:lipopolysaccharide assembly outer membrane protein LptD (OstA)
LNRPHPSPRLRRLASGLAALAIVAGIVPRALAAGTDITADHITRDANGVLVATGHVIIKRKDQTLYADTVHYDVAHHWIKADGHVYLISQKATIEASRANLHTDTQAGTMDDATLTLPDGSHMVAKKIRRLDPDTYEADTLRFSACPSDAEAWSVAASRGRLDEKKGVLVTRNSRFNIKDVPVMYMPYWQTPLRRRSGMLLSLPGTSSQRGTEWALPLYLAPSPNWDATLTPHWMSKRGLMTELELRHASPRGSEQISGERVHDRITNTARGRIGGKVNWRLPHEMYFKVNADHVSDHAYLLDYSKPTQSVISYTTSLASLTGINPYGSWTLLGQEQQNLTQANDLSTLQFLPRLDSTTAVPVNRNLIVHFDQQTTNFYRELGVHGWRMDLNPYLEIPWTLPGGGMDVTAKIGSHLTRYWLQQQTGSSSMLQRATGEASLEVRPVFERISADRQWKHSIEPVLRYDYIHAPANQSNLPNFDSSFAQLTTGNLLMGNRFSGYDRIQRVNRVSLLLESNLWTHEGKDHHVQEVVSAAIGSSYDMLLTTVDPSVQALPTHHLSNLLGQLAINPFPGLSLHSYAQYNAQEKFWATANAGVDVSVPGGHSLSVDYLFTDHRYAATVRQYIARTSVVINRRWSLKGYVLYDALQKLIQQETVGLLYQHPCWSLELQTFRYNRPAGTTSGKDQGFHFLLGFKGMGSVGEHG